MKIVKTLKQSVDTDTADSLLETFRGSIRRVLLAPYKCMMFSITSCLLLGTKYKTFMTIASAICLAFSAVGVVMFVMSKDWFDLIVTVSGLLAILFLLYVMRRDNKHEVFLRIAEKYTAPSLGEQELD